MAAGAGKGYPLFLTQHLNNSWEHLLLFFSISPVWKHLMLANCSLMHLYTHTHCHTHHTTAHTHHFPPHTHTLNNILHCLPMSSLFGLTLQQVGVPAPHPLPYPTAFTQLLPPCLDAYLALPRLLAFAPGVATPVAAAHTLPRRTLPHAAFALCYASHSGICAPAACVLAARYTGIFCHSQHWRLTRLHCHLPAYRARHAPHHAARTAALPPYLCLFHLPSLACTLHHRTCHATSDTSNRKKPPWLPCPNPNQWLSRLVERGLHVWTCVG